MKLRHVKINNFRSLKDVSVPISNTTVLLGENNSGKTAFLDAIRLALRAAVSRTSPFGDYDFYLADSADSPQTSEGITIELWFKEDAPNEWPDALAQALDDIIVTDMDDDIDFVGLRINSRYDELTKHYTNNAVFLSRSRRLQYGVRRRPQI